MSFISNVVCFRFNITSTGAELAEKLLTGTDEMFQPDGSFGDFRSSSSMFAPSGFQQVFLNESYYNRSRLYHFPFERLWMLLTSELTYHSTFDDTE